MADNVRIGADAMNHYTTLIGLKLCLEILREGSSEQDPMFQDPEFNSHLRVMADIHSSLYNEKLRRIAGRRTWVKKSEASKAFDEFIQERRKEYDRAQEYQESRPDLYD